jgi:hypothetical protein
MGTPEKTKSIAPQLVSGIRETLIKPPIAEAFSLILIGETILRRFGP